MLESTIEFLLTVPWYWVIIIAFLTNLAENLLPPVPGDSILLFTGTLIGIGVVGFPEMLIASTLGSALGFAVMYYLGYKFEKKVVESGKFKFISINAIETVEGWFRKYGYWVIVVNRFLSGTRAVISFFAGMSKLNFKPTIIYATVSSLIWNAIILYFGAKFGDNWKLIDHYMSLYGKIIFPIVLVVVIIFIVKLFWKRKKIQ